MNSLFQGHPLFAWPLNAYRYTHPIHPPPRYTKSKLWGSDGRRFRLVRVDPPKRGEWWDGRSEDLRRLRKIQQNPSSGGLDGSMLIHFVLGLLRLDCQSAIFCGVPLESERSQEQTVASRHRVIPFDCDDQNKRFAFSKRCWSVSTS